MFNWTKTLFLIRGLPGEGKSTLALKLVGNDRRRVVENDDYWYVPRTKIPNLQIMGPYYHPEIPDDSHLGPMYEYRYSLPLTHLAANWCGAEAFRRLRIFDSVAVANTFVKREHIIGYVDEARKMQVRVKLHRPSTEWAGNIDACFNKNVHAVPMANIQKMKDQWEEMTQAEIDVLLNLPMDLRGK